MRAARSALMGAGLLSITVMLMIGCPTGTETDDPAPDLTPNGGTGGGDGSGDGGATTGTGSLRVLITDKPFPFELLHSAEITITRVEVRGGAGDREDDEEFVTVFEGQRDFDLLDLQNGRTDVLADAVIPVGTYTQMRLIVTEGRVRLTNERDFVLRVPSGSQSGIKLHFAFTIEDAEETQLLLDVDLSRAFKPIPAGKIDDPDTIREFKFQPSLAMRLIDIVDAGSIAGRVTNEAGEPIGAVAVTAYKGGEEVTSTSTANDGRYVLSGLPAGEYRVEFSASGYQDAEIDGVSVTAGEQTTGIDIVLALEK